MKDMKNKINIFFIPTDSLSEANYSSYCFSEQIKTNQCKLILIILQKTEDIKDTIIQDPLKSELKPAYLRNEKK